MVLKRCGFLEEYILLNRVVVLDVVERSSTPGRPQNLSVRAESNFYQVVNHSSTVAYINIVTLTRLLFYCEQVSLHLFQKSTNMWYAQWVESGGPCSILTDHFKPSK